MSAQPANTDIKIYRNVRAQRQPLWFDSVASLIKRLRPLVMAIPGHEVRVGVITRDTSTKDFSPYMGEARSNATRGFPIVVGLNKQVSFATAQTQLPDVDFAFQIGSDRFIANTTVGLDGDLHSDARDLTADQP